MTALRFQSDDDSREPLSPSKKNDGIIALELTESEPQSISLNEKANDFALLNIPEKRNE